MTESQRIFVNVLASYTRTMLGIACGLFSVRWVLEALGEVDYGLYGVIGSMLILIRFFNIQFSGAVSRFFAYYVGRAKVTSTQTDGIEECRRWFSTAVFVHTVIPVVLVMIGWPIGEHAITHGWLTVPCNRVLACVWVWRYVSVSCFVGMVTVPFSAMFTAKQYISELTIYNIVSLLLQFGFVYYMHLTPGDWLERYGLGLCLIGGLLQVVIAIRSYYLFPECRCRVSYLFDLRRLMQIWKYVIWQTIGGLGYICRVQGVAIVVNKGFGPAMNSAFSIGNTLSLEAAALTGALNHAFTPAITTNCGAENMEVMRALANRASKFGTLLTAIFAVPLFMESEEVLVLWLKNPPEWASTITMGMLIVLVTEKLTLGQVAAINATGKVAQFQIVHGLTWGSALPLAAIGVYFGGGMYAVLGALVATMGVAVCCDVWLAQIHTGLIARDWVLKILAPLLIVIVITACVAYIPTVLFQASFGRVVLTTISSCSVIMPLSWCFMLEDAERQVVAQKIGKLRAKLRF